MDVEFKVTTSLIFSLLEVRVLVSKKRKGIGNKIDIPNKHSRFCVKEIPEPSYRGEVITHQRERRGC